jgi:hypothetical protein
MLKAGVVAQTTHEADRERRKRLWLDPLIADLGTPEASELAAQFRVSKRLLADIAGRIVNLNSFLNAGYVYPSAAGIGRMIKNANGHWTSGRQVRRGISFFRARGWIRVEPRPGSQNWMFPLYRAVAAADTVTGDPGHDVRGVRTSCPPKLINKPENKTIGARAAADCGNGKSGQPDKKPIEGQEVVQHRLAQRLGSGDVERGVLILLELSESRRDQLTAMERVGKLTDVEVASARAGVEARR